MYAAPAFAADDDLYDRIAAANDAFAEGRFEEALNVYESAVEALGDSQALDYNRAAAKYKLGQHAEAAELFSRAAMSPDLDLSRRARFGWGNSDYASALATLQPADPEAGQQPDFQAGIDKLESAIRHYREALAGGGELPADHPGDRAARENIERAQRLIDAIEEFLEQQQQQQNQDQQEQQEQDDQQQQEQQQGQEGNEQEQQQQQQQQSDEQQQEQQEQQQESQQQEEQQEQQQAQQQDQQSAEQQEQTQQQQAQQLEEREMTPEEVEALLQAVRDKEKKRREEQVQRARARRVPVVRDW